MTHAPQPNDGKQARKNQLNQKLRLVDSTSPETYLSGTNQASQLSMHESFAVFEKVFDGLDSASLAKQNFAMPSRHDFVSIYDEVIAKLDIAISLLDEIDLGIHPTTKSNESTDTKTTQADAVTYLSA
jgi:hypothetical protein